MSVYKVAQDVEADDKLIGPFSFRQFIYLIIVALAMAVAWGLSKIALPLAIFPLPIILFFGALALPLRKDQPMEVYMAAMVSFYLKPRRRLWIPDGLDSLVEITAPKVAEVQRTKDLTGAEARKRLSYLATIADTGGWSTKYTEFQSNSTALTNDAWLESQGAVDILDAGGSVSSSINAMMTQADERRRQNIVQQMQQQQFSPTPQLAVTPLPDPYASLPNPTQTTSTYAQPPASPTLMTQPYTAPSIPSVASPATQMSQDDDIGINTVFNPYPSAMHQAVIQPIGQESQATPPTIPTSSAEETSPSTSNIELSPDIIKLAESDLSIENISKQAERIKKREAEQNGEVYVSLR